MAHAQAVAGFDVGVDVDVTPHQITVHHTIVVLEVGGLYQTIWDTMERHFGLEITKPLLYL